MRYLDKRIAGICKELKELSVTKRITIEQLEYKRGNFISPEEANLSEEAFQPFDCNTMHWYGTDQHYWFRTEFSVPKDWKQDCVWLNIRTQIEEWDDAKNPQFLLFLNGEIMQGIDMNHREVLVPKKILEEGTTLTIGFQAYTGTLHKEFKLFVDVQEIDPDITELYYDLWVPVSAFTRMEEDSQCRYELETVLNNTINLLDFRTPYSNDFYASIQNARSYIKKALYEDMAGYQDIIATCIGHTHIDVAWWWTVAQTREKVARSFATVLKLMEEYPNYRFMSSQPQLYQFLKERYPELYEKVKERVKEKKWEPEGGMWVEADCNLTSGESLVRQFLHGKRFFKEEFGVDNRILWLPDVFGYSGALPQIMKKCGIDYFMTTKLAWNQFNKVPYDTMVWRGIDGTEVLTHLITTLGVNQPIKDFFTTYNGMLHPDAIMGGWERYQNKEINNDILVSYGYGDGGGGPTREMLETSLRMEKGIKGIPKVRQAFARTYFEELEERVKENKRLPVWEGEFYFEYHRGTYTSMARNKRFNRKSEFGLMDVELLSILAEQELPYPAKELDAMWKKALLNQFHDILPGSSIKEVYEVTKQEYQELEKQMSELLSVRMKKIAGAGNGVTIFNTTGFCRDDVVCLGDCNAKYLVDDEDCYYPVQQTKSGAFVFVKGIPAKGYRTFGRRDEESKKERELVAPFTLNSDYHLETPYYTVLFDEQGMIKELYDKECRRQVIKENQPANLFRMYEDKPIYYDNWDIDIYYTEKYWDVTDLTSMKWTEVGPVRATLELERKVSNSYIKQKTHFYKDSKRIDFDTYVDWKDHQHLLKVHFPLNVHTDEATFDIQFGNLTRKTHTNTSWDVARFESCGQKWVDLSEGHYGVSLLNDCKYGHSVKDSNLALTLIKSGIEPNKTTDQEEHYFTYALYPHKENIRNADTVKQSYFINQKAYAYLGGTEGTSYSLAKTEHRNVVLETIKKAEVGDGYIVRMYESENSWTQTSLEWSGEIHQVEECNLIEEKIKECSFSDHRIFFDIKPYEIKTFRIR